VCVRFDRFQVDLSSGDLRTSGGVAVRIQQQPLQVLRLLLEAEGKVVSREQLRAALWPDETFVDFEHGVNTAVRRLRQALEDSGDNPRFIETLPKVGHRFIAPVEWLTSAGDRHGLHSVVPIVPPGLNAAVNKLRETLGDSAATPTYVETVQGRGYRFIGKIESDAISPDQTLNRRRLWGIVAVCIVTLGVAVGGAWYLRSGKASQIDSIAVLPFTNGGGDANTEYLSDGITESLIGNLAHVPELKVKSRNSVFRYKGKDVDAQKVGSDLGVATLVSGRVVPRGDSIEVSAELTDVRDNTEIWGQHYSGKSANIISLQQQIAGDIAGKLRSKLTSSEKQQVAKQGTQNPEAYELYLKGRYSWNKRTAADLETALSYFNQAIAKDPGYALAYSGLAETYAVLPNYGGTPSENVPKSNAAARKALELDATLARPHAVLGYNEMEYDWDFAGGEAEFKKALELDPNDATARQWYAEEIGKIGGREQEALAEINRARELDPLSPIISTVAGYLHNSARQYDEAIAVCKNLANENPTFANVHVCLAYGYWGKRMYPQVIEELKAYGQLSGDRNESEFTSALEHGFRSAGWRGALTKAIEARRAQRNTGYSSAYDIAKLYADLGDKDQAFRWLNTAYQERDVGLVNLKTDFLLDPLRSDPRFAELVRKVGLPQ
jgi:TolB-like protein/DNA-binding winged helix-turn-helix (wHTH) protein